MKFMVVLLLFLAGCSFMGDREELSFTCSASDTLYRGCAVVMDTTKFAFGKDFYEGFFLINSSNLSERERGKAILEVVVKNANHPEMIRLAKFELDHVGVPPGQLLQDAR